MNRREALRGIGVLAATAMVPGSAIAAPLPFDGRTKETIVLHGGTVHVGTGKTIESATVVIRGARFARVGTAGTAPKGAKTIDVKGKIITPGLIAADTNLGLTEIDLEDSTRDDGPETEDAIRSGYDAASAVHADSALIQVQAVEGITSAAVTPRGGLFSGQVAWIDLEAGQHRAIVAKPRIAARAHLGQNKWRSRAATLAKLRETLDDARFFAARRGAFDRRQTRDLAAHRLDLEALGPVLARRIPLVLSAHRSSDILAAIDLAREYRIRIVVLGGAQAWRVADAIADAKVPVIVQPSANLPGGFDRIGARMDNAALLHKAGVQIGIARLGDAHNIRNVTQEAGIAVANGLDRAVALQAITANIARAYGMDADYGSIAAGKVANLAIWDADPFELRNWPRQVYIRGRAIAMRSRQTLLRDRYLDLGRYDGRR